MDTKALRQKILDLAIRGKLVPQDPNDEPASVLLERIREEKKKMVKEGKLKAKDIKNDTIIFKGEDNLHYEKFQDGTEKCIEDEIPFEIPEGWSWTSIDSIAFVTKLAGFEYTKNIAPNLVEDGIPLFKGKNVQDSTIIYEFESFIPEEVSDDLVRSQITKKCILTPYVGTIGNIGIHDQPGKYHLGSNVGKVELYNENVVLKEEWVVYYLQSQYGYNQLTKHMKATAQASISIAAIREVYLPVPPANEQERLCDEISNIINMLTEINESKEAVAELVNCTKNKILDLAIRGKLIPQNTNDEPASALLERIRAEKKELIKHGKLKRDKKESIIYKGDDNSYYEKFSDGTEKNITDILPFEIPESWTWCRLTNISSIVMGTSPKGTTISSNENDVEFHQGKIFFSDKYLVQGNQFTSEVTKIAHANSVLLCVRAPVGEVNITQRDICIGRGLSALFPMCGMTADFLYYWIKAFKQSLESKATGTTFKAITTDVVKELLLPLPPIGEQIRIMNLLKESDETLNNIKASLS